MASDHKKEFISLFLNIALVSSQIVQLICLKTLFFIGKLGKQLGASSERSERSELSPNYYWALWALWALWADLSLLELLFTLLT